MTRLKIAPGATAQLNTNGDAQFATTRRVLQFIFPPGSCKEDDIAVAGSTPLSWLQTFANIGPRWDAGPSDIDVFVCGFYAAFFDILIHYVEKKLTNGSYVISSKRKYRHCYANALGPISICDIKLEVLNIKLSLIQCPFDRNIYSVIQSFDINVCRVVYSIEKDEIWVPNEVYRSIEASEATVDDFRFGTTGPSRFASTKVARTILRMQKYTNRGYTFSNGGGITFTI